MSRIAVYTAITGKFPNKLHAPLVPLGTNVDLICFADCVWAAPSPWKILPPYWEHDTDPRRTARFHKVQAHVVLPDYDYWIWMDGNQQLDEDPRKLVEMYLSDSVHFASYKHPERNCVTQELEACIRLKKDDPEVMQAQVDRYMAEGYPLAHGLFETTVVIRRNSAEIQTMNGFWWNEVCIGSKRDQLSLNYVLWKGLQSGHDMRAVNTKFVEGQRDNPVHFKYHRHR